MSADLRLPYGDDGSKLKSATASFAHFLNNRTDITVLENSYTSYATYSDYLVVAAADAAADESAGVFSTLSSRLIPRNLFTTAEAVDSLVDGVIEGIARSRSVLNLTATQVVLESPVTNLDSNNMTSALPAWRDALWHVIHTGEWVKPLKPAIQKAATDGFLHAVDPLKALTPGGGAYFNEAHFDEPNWKDTFFGSNYDRLLEIKNRYDVTHIFDCWKFVGWRGKQE